MNRRKRITILAVMALLGGLGTAIVLSTAAAPVSASAAGAESSSATTTSTTTPAQPIGEAQIDSIARQAAASMGEPSPSDIAHSEGTRAAAVTVSSGEVVEGSNDSFLIAEHGQFVGTSVHRPPGEPAPQGSVLTLVVDAYTGEITDLGIQDNYPDLSALGPVTQDQ